VALASLHLRVLWGLVDLSEAESQTPVYVNPTDYALAGDSAAVGAGVGVRRCTVVLDRQVVTPTDDAGNMHFDFMNITGGNPDDTWITSDYTTLEALINTWWTSVKPLCPTWFRKARYSWHRVGPGVAKPNPAERILDFVSPVAGTAGNFLPPQCASSITMRTAVRRSWGRTYLPFGKGLMATGRLDSADADTLATATQTLLHGAAAADFLPGVVSYHLNSFLGTETVEVDDTVDIIRRRRWKHTTYRKLIAV
jgi:hypothetical protein